MISSFEILQTRIGKQYTYMLGAYVTRSINSGRTKNLASLNRITQLFQAQATYDCLLDQAGCRQSNQFPNRGRDRLCKQQGAQVLQRILISVQNELLYFRALPYSTLGMTIFRYLVLTKSTISACTVVVKRSSIQSDINPNSDTRRE